MRYSIKLVLVTSFFLSICLSTTAQNKNVIDEKLNELNIILPQAPKPVGNYAPYVISNNKVYINQVALLDGKILHQGRLGETVSIEQGKEATRQTMLNVLAVLKEATNGDLSRVERCVQLTGFFCTTPQFSQHAEVMNVASEVVAQIFGDKGKHARATVGAYSLPLSSAVEIQAIFEIK